MGISRAEQRANEVVERAVHRIDRSVLSAFERERVYDLLVEADLALAKRLARIVRRTGGVEATFTEARLHAYRAQIRMILARLQPKLVRRVNQASDQAIDQSMARTVEILTEFEKLYHGVAVAPGIEDAQQLDSLSRRAKGSLLSRHSASIERYGDHMIREFERQLRIGMTAGESQGEMVERLTGYKPGNQRGVFRRQAYWARRIVRTEAAYGQNSSSNEAITEAKRQFPDMKRKIVATFDNRTAGDSKYVHGQIRAVGEPFTDGKGRVYLHPPGRPNDREILIPWRDVWPELPSTKPKPPDWVGEQELKALPEYERPKGKAGKIQRQRVAGAIRDERKAQAQARKAARALAVQPRDVTG